MGNEFDTIMEPFAIFRFYNSLCIAAAMTVISFLTSIEGYRIFLIVCLLIAVFSQIIMIVLFPFRPKLSKQIIFKPEADEGSEMQQMLNGENYNKE